MGNQYIKPTKEVKSTMSLGNVFCPKCGKVGQAKYRRGRHQIYLEIDHYGRKHKDPTKDKFTTHHYTYNSTCYIGNLDSPKVQNLNLKSISLSTPQTISIEVKQL